VSLLYSYILSFFLCCWVLFVGLVGETLPCPFLCFSFLLVLHLFFKKFIINFFFGFLNLTNFYYNLDFLL
jgi:hypothetical protein